MLGCKQHKAFIYDRGGVRKIGALGNLSLVRWERRRDDVSQATVRIPVPSKECLTSVGLAESGRAELVLFRGDDRVWEGPLTHITTEGSTIELQARDVMHYVNRTIMRAEYDNRHPNNSLALDRVKRIMNAEMARKEALDPPANILPWVEYVYASSPGVTDAGTSSHTLPYESTVFNHIDALAARGGLDYTVVGRKIIFFDVHQPLGQTAQVTAKDFIGDPIITQYGMELATAVTFTDGKGHWGTYGGDDPYYGEWEMLFQAYDENAEPDPNNPVGPDDVPSTAELVSQARRTWAQGSRPPLVVRVPDNTSLNPAGSLAISDLVPGIWIPLSATLPGRSVSQMQKLDNMQVEETAAGGENIKVTLSPAPQETIYAE
jgi:hypothetical protein